MGQTAFDKPSSPGAGAFALICGIAGLLVVMSIVALIFGVEETANPAPQPAPLVDLGATPGTFLAERPEGRFLQDRPKGAFIDLD